MAREGSLEIRPAVHTDHADPYERPGPAHGQLIDVSTGAAAAGRTGLVQDEESNSAQLYTGAHRRLDAYNNRTRSARISRTMFSVLTI